MIEAFLRIHLQSTDTYAAYAITAFVNDMAYLQSGTHIYLQWFLNKSSAVTIYRYLFSPLELNPSWIGSLTKKHLILTILSSKIRKLVNLYNQNYEDTITLSQDFNDIEALGKQKYENELEYID